MVLFGLFVLCLLGGIRLRWCGLDCLFCAIFFLSKPIIMGHLLL